MRRIVPLTIGCFIGSILPCAGCINDSFHISEPVPLSGSADAALRLAIRGEGNPGPTPDQLKSKIAKLEASPKKLSPVWWNELAGAYLRLGDAAKAASLLEPVVEKFSDDYGIHANLGTAYHLLGRYKEAEKQIAEDLRINPNGHSGLEVFHLALLQYLSAPQEWQANHLFLDEWTHAFFASGTSTGVNLSLVEKGLKPPSLSLFPSYRSMYELATSPLQERGVAYMTSLNQEQPACFVVAGMLALAAEDGTLAKQAFQKAIRLGSPQKAQLEQWIAHIGTVRNYKPISWATIITTSPFVIAAALVLAAIVMKLREMRRPVRA